MQFEAGKSIGEVAMILGVKYATARVWWMMWRIAALEEENEQLESKIIELKQER